jgi:hypothetical protein
MIATTLKFGRIAVATVTEDTQEGAAVRTSCSVNGWTISGLRN